jgi:signal transduction histidine kinase
MTSDPERRDALWAAMAASVPFYLGIVSLDNRLQYLNRTDNLDLPSDFAGKPLVELFPDHAAVLCGAIDRVVIRGIGEQVEIANRLPTRTQWIAIHLTPIREDGRITGVLGLGIDVTDSRHASLELRMSVNALHRLLEEREQMAADLHDGILQSLYGVGLRLEAARAAAKAGTGGGHGDHHMDRAIADLNRTMAEIRHFIAVGRSSPRATANWEDTLAGVLRSLIVEGGPSLHLEISPTAAARIPAADRSEIVFIAREAVSNAVRHSGATRIDVRLVESPQGVRLEIEDDGRGFHPDRSTEGLGLLTMTRRAGRMGAILSLSPVENQGTTIHLDLAAAVPS